MAIHEVVDALEKLIKSKSQVNMDTLEEVLSGTHSAKAAEHLKLAQEHADTPELSDAHYNAHIAHTVAEARHLTTANTPVVEEPMAAGAAAPAPSAPAAQPAQAAGREKILSEIVSVIEQIVNGRTPQAHDAWNEADHPRGQPNNAGEFSSGGGASVSSGGGEKKQQAVLREMHALLKAVK